METDLHLQVSVDSALSLDLQNIITLQSKHVTAPDMACGAFPIQRIKWRWQAENPGKMWSDAGKVV